MKKQPIWLKCVKELQSIAQEGLAYSQNPFDLQRYERLRDLTAEMTALHVEQDMQVVQDLFAKEMGYLTPKLDIRGVVFQGDKILMVKEVADGCWSLPGGWSDVNISPSETVVKEIFEETGYRARSKKMLALYDKLKHDYPFELPHAYKCFILCEIIGGEPKTSLETTEIGFFSEHNLPPLSQNRIIESQIKRMFEHLRCPDLPTDFD